MAIGDVYFQGESATAHIEGLGDEPVRYTPVVCNQLIYPEAGIINYGIGAVLDDGRSICWGLCGPADLIASWRGTEVLRRLKAIRRESLCLAWHAGRRKPREDDRKTYVEPMIEVIGRPALDEIMSMRIPEQIIRSILDDRYEEGGHFLKPITEEVRAGTIEWRQEFADAGVVHPRDLDSA